MIEGFKKKQITLQDFFDAEVAKRERIVLSELEHAIWLVEQKKGKKGVRFVLDMFGIADLKKLSVIRYNQFIIVCKAQLL